MTVVRGSHERCSPFDALGIACGSVAVTAAVFLGSIYANLSFTVADGNFRYFPPFNPQHNANQNHHLGAEYYNIAKSLVAGDGFANPFGEATGPTAWMPPVLPMVLAGLIWLCDGDQDVVMAMVIFLQVYAMIATGLLVLSLAQRTTRIWPGVVALLFVLALVNNFHLCFQVTHDYWLILFARPAGRRPVLVAAVGEPEECGRLGGVRRLLCPGQPGRRLLLGHPDRRAGPTARAWRELGIAALSPGSAWPPGRFAT